MRKPLSGSPRTASSQTGKMGSGKYEQATLTLG